jgi:hypothetical protein
MSKKNIVNDSKLSKNGEEDIVEELRDSYRKLGPVRPIITTQFGIAGGETRRKADPSWPEQHVNVNSYYDHLRVKAADNVQARKPPSWWMALLDEAAREIVKSGVEPTGITQRLVHDFPLAARTILEYLPEKYKSKTKVRAGALGGRAAAAAAEKARNGQKALTSVGELTSGIERGDLKGFAEKGEKATEKTEKEDMTTIDDEAIEKLTMDIKEGVAKWVEDRFNSFERNFQHQFAEMRVSLVAETAGRENGVPTVESIHETLNAETQLFPVMVQLSEVRRTLFRAWQAKHPEYIGTLETFMVECFDAFFIQRKISLRYIEGLDPGPNTGISR